MAKQVKVSIPLSGGVHRAAKLEAVMRIDTSLSSILAEIIDARLIGAKLPKPLSSVTPDGSVGMIRPSVFLSAEQFRAVERSAKRARTTVPQLLAEWIAAHFERRKAA